MRTLYTAGSAFHASGATPAIRRLPLRRTQALVFSEARDPDCVFQIVEYGSRAVGVVRLDLVEEPSTYEVSVLVEPAVQGRGIGAPP